MTTNWPLTGKSAGRGPTPSSSGPLLGCVGFWWPPEGDLAAAHPKLGWPPPCPNPQGALRPAFPSSSFCYWCLLIMGWGLGLGLGLSHFVAVWVWESGRLQYGYRHYGVRREQGALSLLGDQDHTGHLKRVVMPPLIDCRVNASKAQFHPGGLGRVLRSLMALVLLLASHPSLFQCHLNNFIY